MSEDKIKVCCGNKCSDRGALRILETIEKEFGRDRVEMVECMGYCEIGPNVVSGEKIYHECRAKTICERLKKSDGVPMNKITIDDLNLDDLL